MTGRRSREEQKKWTVKDLALVCACDTERERESRSKGTEEEMKTLTMALPVCANETLSTFQRRQQKNGGGEEGRKRRYCITYLHEYPSPSLSKK